MARYSYVGAPGGLQQVPSLGSYPGVSLPSSTGGTVVLPAAAGAGLSQMLLPIIGEIIGNVVGEAATSAGRVATGAGTPSEQPSLQSASKYTVSPMDVAEIYRQVNQENYRRSLSNKFLGTDLPALDPEEIVNETVSRNRVLMEEAGARERALEAIKQTGTIQQAYANTLGTGLTSSGKLLEQSIASILTRPPVEASAVLSESARAL